MAERPLAVSINEYAPWLPPVLRGQKQTVEVFMKLFSFWRSLATYRVRIALKLNPQANRTPDHSRRNRSVRRSTGNQRQPPSNEPRNGRRRFLR
jgi:hypothetical protein